MENFTRNKILVVILALVASCGGKGSDEASQFAPIVIDSTPVDFAGLKSQVLQDNCIRCHADFKDSVSDVVVAGNLDKSSLFTMVNSGAMPPGGPKLSPTLINVVRNYVKGVAPAAVEQAATPTTAQPANPAEVPIENPSPVKVNWNLLKTDLFEKSCVRCHAPKPGDDPAHPKYEDPLLTDLESVKAAAKSIQDELDGGTMPPPRARNVIKPTQEIIEAFRAWTKAGFPEQ